jgi:hypothetical protein
MRTLVIWVTSFQWAITHSARNAELGRSDIGAPGQSPISIFQSLRRRLFADLKGFVYMRSDLVYGAALDVSNRYQLCQLTAKAARKLHKPNARLQDTINDVLAQLNVSSTADSSAKPVEIAVERAA